MISCHTGTLPTFRKTKMHALTWPQPCEVEHIPHWLPCQPLHQMRANKASTTDHENFCVLNVLPLALLVSCLCFPTLLERSHLQSDPHRTHVSSSLLISCRIAFSCVPSDPPRLPEQLTHRVLERSTYVGTETLNTVAQVLRNKAGKNRNWTNPIREFRSASERR